MLSMNCPFCGERDISEFSYGHEAHIARPANPSAMSDDAWADYLFMRENPKGLHFERWVHTHGCRRWFNVARNTYTDRILAIYKMGDPPPKVDNPGPTGLAAPVDPAPRLHVVGGTEADQ